MMIHRTKHSNEQGSAGMKAVIAIVILGVFIYGAFQLVPLYWDHWNFEDAVETEVKFAFVNYGGPDIQKKLTNAVIGFLNNMNNVQYEKKDVKVQVDPGKKKIVVEVWYVRSHKLPILQNPKQFHVKAENVPI